MTLVEVHVGVARRIAKAHANTVTDIDVGDRATSCTSSLVGGRAVRPRISLPGWPRVGAERELPRIPAHRRRPAGPQPTLCHHRRARAPSSTSPALPRFAATSTSTPRSWSTTPCRAAAAASCSGACWPTARAACSRARSSYGPDAQKTDGKQMAQALMLSPRRRVRLQARARDLRRRRGVRPRLDRRPKSTRTCSSICSSRGIPARRRHVPCLSGRSSARRSTRSRTRRSARGADRTRGGLARAPGA